MITHVNRFENWDGNGKDLHVVFYATGRSRSFLGWAALPKTVRRFIAKAKNFEFRKGITGQFYHRFS